jgi:hypothetical protein
MAIGDTPNASMAPKQAFNARQIICLWLTIDDRPHDNCVTGRH